MSTPDSHQNFPQVNLSCLQLMFEDVSGMNKLNYSQLEKAIDVCHASKLKGLVSTLKAQLQDQESINDAAEALYGNHIGCSNLSRTNSLLKSSLTFYLNCNFDFNRVGIMYRPAIEFVAETIKSKKGLAEKRIQAKVIVAYMNWASQYHLLSELGRCLQNPNLTIDSRNSLVIYELLILLSINLIEIYGSPKVKTNANKVFERFTLNQDSSEIINLTTIAISLMQPFIDKINLLPKAEVIQDAFSFEARHCDTYDPKSIIRYNKELLLDAAVYTAPRETHYFSSSKDDQLSAIKLIKETKLAKGKVIAYTQEGMKKEFFISQDGDLCVKTSARRGTKLHFGEFEFNRVELYKSTNDRQKRLALIRSDLENTRKYIQKANSNSSRHNLYADKAKKANPWLSPFKNGLTTGSLNDGEIFTVKRLLSKASDSDKRDIENSIKNNTELRCRVSLNNKQECLYNAFREELNGGVVKWQAFITVRSSSGNGGKEYSYGLINCLEFIGYDID